MSVKKASAKKAAKKAPARKPAKKAVRAAKVQRGTSGTGPRIVDATKRSKKVKKNPCD